MQRPDGAPARDPRAARQMVARLALVAVQGEQLQMLCSELETVLALVRCDPRLQAPAATLAAVLAEVSGVARDIAVVTETLGHGLQQPGPVGHGAGAAAQTAVSVPRKA